MEQLNFLRKLFEYDYWANRESLTSLGSGGSGPDDGLKFLGHVIGAQRIWFSRISKDGSSPPAAWPSLTIDECHAAVEDLHKRWANFLSTLLPDQLTEEVSYRNLKGAEFKTRLEDVLQHILFHSAYHRGQVAAAVRRSGGVPSPTDYVVYVRHKS
jgi:uncharacterized damage-inducible protein DinB